MRDIVHERAVIHELAGEIAAYSDMLATLFAGPDADVAIEGARLVALEIGARADLIKGHARD